MQHQDLFLTSLGGTTSFATFVLDALDAAPFAFDLATHQLSHTSRLSAMLDRPINQPLTVGDVQTQIHPEDLAVGIATVRDALGRTTPYFQCVCRMLRSDGDVRWLLSRGEVARNEAGQAVIIRGVVIDITKQKHDEAAVPENEPWHRTWFHAIDESICIFERLPLRPDGRRDYRYLAMNKAMQTMFGIPDLSGQSIRDNFPDEAEAWYDDYDRVLETNQPIRFERESVPQGMVLEMFVTRLEDSSGQRLLAVIRDVTERKRAEVALRMSEERFRLFMRASSDTTYTLSPDWSEMLNLEGKEFIASTQHPSRSWLEEYIPEQDQEHVLAAIREAITHKRLFALEHRVVLLNGTLGWAFSRAVPMLNAQGDISEWVGTARDITAAKQAEVAQRAGEAQKAFLLQLSDALRAEVDADAVAHRAICMLSEQLQLDRCCIAVYQLKADHADFTHQAGNDRVPPLPESGIRLSDFPEAFRVVFDQTLIIDDVAATERLSDADRRNMSALGLRALVAATLRKGEHNPQWVMVAFSASPRRWTHGEIALVEEVAERTWAAMERARAETVVRESEAKYRTLFNSMDEGFCLIEMIYDAAIPIDYRFLEVNPAFERQTGITNAVGRTMRDIALQHEDSWLEIYGYVARSGVPVRFEHRANQPTRFYDVYAFCVGEPAEHKVAVLFNDSTERKQAETQLAAAAARNQYLVQLADALRPLSDAVAIEQTVTRILGEQLGANRVAYFEVDGEDYVAERYYSDGVVSPRGRFSSISFGPRQLATYRAGHIVIDPDVIANTELTPAEQQAFAAYQIAAHVGIPLVKDGQFVAGLAVHQMTPRAWTADEVALIEETAERTWAAIERARAEARLQQLYAQEQEARKAAEEASRFKDEFLTTISHELRTPLTALLGYSELLLRRQRDAAFVAQAVDKLAQSAKAQARLIEDLLDTSRIVNGKLRIEPTPMNLIAVIHAAVDTVLPSVEARRQTIQLALDPAASRVFGDANRLQQVVWNLLSNAAKFSSSGGVITVELASVGNEAVLSVRDQGQGITPTFLPYVFERFRQAESTSERVHGGLGLGLAIVKSLVELHGGRVSVASAGTNQGATFTVHLPLAQAAAGTDVRHTRHGATPQHSLLPLQGLRILVVDDHPMVLEFLKEVLCADGATVQTCLAAREALALVDQWQPDVLVSDIAMPNEDGYWLIAQLRRHPGVGLIPAIALTAYVRIEERVRVLAAGFQWYLTKPIEADELRSAILHVVHKKTEL